MTEGQSERAGQAIIGTGVFSSRLQPLKLFDA
jgi:hypothetical protein